MTKQNCLVAVRVEHASLSLPSCLLGSNYGYREQCSFAKLYLFKDANNQTNHATHIQKLIIGDRNKLATYSYPCSIVEDGIQSKSHTKHKRFYRSFLVRGLSQFATSITFGSLQNQNANQQVFTLAKISVSQLLIKINIDANLTKINIDANQQATQVLGWTVGA